jgi:di/tricarboxylate transporter
MVRRAARRGDAEINIGEVAFLAGIIISIAAAFIPTEIVTKGVVYLVLLILGFIVGLLNLRKEEYTTFLLVSLIFLIPGAFESIYQLSVIGEPLKNILTSISTFVLPAALIVAFKTLWNIASTH